VVSFLIPLTVAEEIRIMNMERRYTQFPSPVGVELRGDAKTPIITGYAAVFYDPADAGTEYKMYSDFIERISPGAFDRAMKEDDCRALFNHEPTIILGRTTSGTCKLYKDAKGLRYEITPPDTNTAKEILESIRRGDISGSSFGFRVRKQTWKEEKTDRGWVDYRYLDDVELLDVGPVTFPAYTATTTGMRGAGMDDSLAQEIEKRRAARRADGHPAATRAKFLELLAKTS
jgi:HK97 family phage prohead protease